MLNVRSQPKTINKPKSNVIGKLQNGTKVKVIGKSSNWYQIVFGKQKGWVSANYIK